MDKKRILFVGEGSILNTGFSTYYRELIPRLVSTGKYEIAEIGSYVKNTDPRIKSFINDRWEFHGGMPTTQEEQNIFNQPDERPRAKGANTNQFGRHILDKVCADFKPDIVIDIRDPWMCEHILDSAFRDWFKFMWMPTVDSYPQSEEWVKYFEDTDQIAAYADYGIHTLKQQSSKINLYPTPLRPGVDLKTFKKLDKGSVRDKFGLSKDIKIVGTVMRNQSRKLILRFLDAFSLMKNKYKGNDSIDKAAVLIHSSWPDNAYSFDYPRHIHRVSSWTHYPYHHKGLINEVLQTLMCHSCGEYSVGFAASLHGKTPNPQMGGIAMPCSNCGKPTATCANTGNGFSREGLADVYNLMDLYVQMTIAEGDAMPGQESKACGVPILVTDYSAVAEKGRFPSEYKHMKGIKESDYTVNKGGDIINIEAMRHEPETGCMRAVPSVEHCADQMARYLMDDDALEKLSKEAIECVEENYDWDKNYLNWVDVLDNMKTHDRDKTWGSAKDMVRKNIPQFSEVNNSQSKKDFVKFLYKDVLGYPRVDTDGAKMWQKYLNDGVKREVIYQEFVKIVNSGNSNDEKKMDLLFPKTNGNDKKSSEKWV